MKTSLNDKLVKATSAAFKIADGFNDNEELMRAKGFTEEDIERIYGYVDGLVQNWIVDTLNGHCSLARTIKWGLTELEDLLDRDITRFK